MKKSIALVVILGYTLIKILRSVSDYIIRDLPTFTDELNLTLEKASVDKDLFKRWLWRKDIEDLILMLPSD